VIYPSKGIGRTETTRGVSEWKARLGERAFWSARLTAAETGRGQMVQFDPDAWKSFVWERLTCPLGGRGVLTLFGDRTTDHTMFGDHLAAEYSSPKTVRGVVFDKWETCPRPGVDKPDNHFLDTLVGCAVAAGVTGLVWRPTESVLVKKPKKRVDIEDLYRHAEAPS